jgi:hypothetical protein
MTTSKTPVTFSLQFVSITISSFVMSGFPEGDAATFVFGNDDFEKSESSDGFVIFVQKHNNTLDGMIRLQQGNPLIAQLRALHEASLAAGGLHYPFMAKNLKSPDELVRGSLLFKKRFDIKWGDSANPVEVPFFLTTDNMDGGTITPT